MNYVMKIKCMSGHQVQILVFSFLETNNYARHDFNYHFSVCFKMVLTVPRTIPNVQNEYYITEVNVNLIAVENN